MKAHLINWSKIVETGFLHIHKLKFAKINPTPIATPAREINGILEAIYLKPNITKPTNKTKDKSRFQYTIHNITFKLKFQLLFVDNSGS